MPRTLLTVAAALTLTASVVAAQDTAAARAATPAPAPAAAPQQGGSAISPGMTEAQVVALWGAPAAKRTAGAWTFLLYPNGVEREVRFMDVVFLQNGQVVDAVLRGAGHVYTGQSSSPPGRVPEFTAPGHGGAANPAGGSVTGVRINP